MQGDPPDSVPTGGPSPDGGEPNAPNLRARVPDHVSPGVFSTGVIVMTRPTEVVLDFVQTLGRPQRVSARIVMPHPVLPQFIEALRKNVELYTSRFGAPTAPQPPNADPAAAQRKRSAEEIYDDLDIHDTLLSGVYANGVMIGHGATEFSFDFLTSFFPQSAVSARVFLAAGQIPRLLESLRGAHQNMQPKTPPPTEQNPRSDQTPDDNLPPSSPQGDDS